MPDPRSISCTSTPDRVRSASPLMRTFFFRLVCARRQAAGLATSWRSRIATPQHKDANRSLASTLEHPRRCGTQAVLFWQFSLLAALQGDRWNTHDGALSRGTRRRATCQCVHWCRAAIVSDSPHAARAASVSASRRLTTAAISCLPSLVQRAMAAFVFASAHRRHRQGAGGRGAW